MAEGLLGGILGEEDEKPDVETSDALAGAEAFASAVAAKLAGNDPEVARKTVEFLSKQSQLLETQNAQLKDEHAARLHFLQGQAREVDSRRLPVGARSQCPRPLRSRDPVGSRRAVRGPPCIVVP